MLLSNSLGYKSNGRRYPHNESNRLYTALPLSTFFDRPNSKMPLVVTSVVASVRNNGNRRFFEPYLLDRYGDRGTYFGQKLNGNNSGILGSGALNDPGWNGMADPKWSPNGTRIVYYQTQAISPACGGTNPLPCYPSTEPQERAYRLFVATLTSRTPKTITPPAPIPNVVPWGTPYVPGMADPVRAPFPEGLFTLKGAVSGSATVTIAYLPHTTFVNFVGVTYHNFSDDGLHFIAGSENVTYAPSSTVQHLEWYSELYQTGAVTATKLTSPKGFHVTIDEWFPLFEVNRTLTTTVEGVAWAQPGDGTLKRLDIEEVQSEQHQAFFEYMLQIFILYL